MKKMLKVLALLLAVYLVASLAASVVVTVTDDDDLYRSIVNHRYGLLVSVLTEDEFVILSPFNNYCDVFLLVVSWADDFYIYSDGFYGFGEW